MEHLDPAALAAFQDGGLTPAERRVAEAHLPECAKCRDRLGAQVRAAAGTIRPGRRVRGELLAAAAVGALLLGTVLWWGADRVTPERGLSLPERAAAPRPRETAPAPPTTASPPDRELAETERGIRADPAAEPDLEESVEPELLALRGGTREMDGKTFRLQGDEWVDDAWTASPGRPPVRLVRGTDSWRAALNERPALARYSEVGPRVLVVLDSLAFRILPGP